MDHVTATDNTELGSGRPVVLLAGFIRTFFGVDTARDPVSEESLAWARSVSMQASLKATLDCLKSFSSTDFCSDLAAFKVPTLIIHGTEDKTVPIDASSRAAARGIKHSTWSSTTARRMGCLRPTSVGSPRT